MFKKILCPVDLKKSSHSALIHAFHLASMVEGIVMIVHASKSVLSDEEEVMLRISLDRFHEQENVAIKEISEKIARMIETPELKQLVQNVRHEVFVIAMEHDAGKAISKFAITMGAELIVISKRGSKSIVEIIFNDVAEHVIYSNQLPVLIVSERNEE
jgi:nucleotide-binding universal stress UspA family protein